jgi:AcrR family transcriptional regulator
MVVADSGGRRVEREGGGARERLLAAVVGHVSAHGLGELSLRELAAAIGTSHRMLIYHFGSREGLMVAVVQAVEAAQRAFLAELSADESLTPAELMRKMWRRLADPSLWPSERLFFEIYSQALQGRPGTAGLLDDIVDSWVEAMVDLARRRGQDTEAARVDARLGVAVSRGLLLDLLATRDRAAVDEAVERYLAQYEALNGAGDRGGVVQHADPGDDAGGGAGRVA